MDLIHLFTELLKYTILIGGTGVIIYLLIYFVKLVFKEKIGVGEAIQIMRNIGKQLKQTKEETKEEKKKTTKKVKKKKKPGVITIPEINNEGKVVQKEINVFGGKE